jgi:cation diffusion facilitator family transporter
MDDSKLAIYGAIAANIAIAITKFIVAGFTGSSAMLSEGVHSAVDTFNGILLLVGLRLSKRPATDEHPFGHGKELYFWSLIVAVLIFGVGGGVSLYEGILHVRSPNPLEDPHWNYIVLAGAALFEGASFALAFRQFSRERGDTPFWQALHTSKDPTTYTVMAEDAAALAGLVIAALGVFFSHRLDMPRVDGAASIAIGLLLAGVAVLLIRESRGLLVGEGVSAETVQAIQAIAQAEAGVREVGRVLTMYVGPDDLLVTFDLSFAPEVPANDVATAIRSIEKKVRERFPRVRRIFLEPVRSSAASAAAAAAARENPP